MRHLPKGFSDAMIVERTGWTIQELQEQPEWLIDALSSIILVDKKVARQQHKEIMQHGPK